MSSWFDLAEASGAAYAANCFGYEDTILSKTIVVLDYYPLFLTVGMLMLSITHFEVFYWVLTMGLFIDIPLNYGLRLLIGPSDNIQPPTCPITQYQMPAPGIEEITVLWVVGWGMALVLYPRVVSTSITALHTVIATCAAYTRVYLMFSSTAQLLAGAGVGLAVGIAYLACVVVADRFGLIALIVKAPATLLGWPIDTMINQKSPTVHLPANATSVNLIIETN